MLIPWNRWQAYCRESRFVVYRIVVEKGFSRRTLLSAISEQETVLLPWRCLGEKERGEYIFLGLENRARLREAGKWKRKIWYTSNSTPITYAFKSPSSFDERFFFNWSKKKKNQICGPLSMKQTQQDFFENIQVKTSHINFIENLFEPKSNHLDSALVSPS